jgi:flagellin
MGVTVLIINNNLPAVNTYNKIKQNNSLTSKQASKLSSGLRINSAADDAAGQAISQGMKTQIRGLQQTQRNIQDGISLIHTADSGLANIVDPNMLRLRELGVQASNDTLTNSELSQIHNEVNQILSGIDDIANNTEFNGINLLNGTNPHKDLSQIVDTRPRYNYENVLKVPPVDSNGRFSFGTNLGYPTTEEDNDKILVYGHGGTSRPKIFIDGTAHDLHDGTTYLSQSTTEVNGVYKTLYKIGNVEVTQSVSLNKDKYEIKYSVENKDSNSHSIGVQYHIDTMLGNDDRAPFIVNDEMIANEKDYTGTSIPDSFIVYNQNTGVGANAKIQATGVIKGEGIIKAPDRFGVGMYFSVSAYNWTPDSNQAVGDSGYSLWWNPETVEVANKFEVNTFYGLSVPPTIEDPTEIVEEPVEGPYDINLQVGANSGENFKVQLSDVRTEKLFEMALDFSTIISARESISKIDVAMEKVIKERTKYGAYENALDHINNNVANYESNVASAKSRIEDADMAKEYLLYAKGKLLSESSQAMLAQSREMPQRVLELFKNSGQ